MISELQKLRLKSKLDETDLNNIIKELPEVSIIPQGYQLIIQDKEGVESTHIYDTWMKSYITNKWEN